MIIRRQLIALLVVGCIGCTGWQLAGAETFLQYNGLQNRNNSGNVVYFGGNTGSINAPFGETTLSYSRTGTVYFGSKINGVSATLGGAPVLFGYIDNSIVEGDIYAGASVGNGGSVVMNNSQIRFGVYDSWVDGDVYAGSKADALGSAAINATVYLTVANVRFDRSGGNIYGYGNGGALNTVNAADLLFYNENDYYQTIDGFDTVTIVNDEGNFGGTVTNTTGSTAITFYNRDDGRVQGADFTGYAGAATITVYDLSEVYNSWRNTDFADANLSGKIYSALPYNTAGNTNILGIGVTYNAVVLPGHSNYYLTANPAVDVVWATVIDANTVIGSVDWSSKSNVRINDNINIYNDGGVNFILSPDLTVFEDVSVYGSDLNIQTGGGVLIGEWLYSSRNLSIDNLASGSQVEGLVSEKNITVSGNSAVLPNVTMWCGNTLTLINATAGTLDDAYLRAAAISVTNDGHLTGQLIAPEVTIANQNSGDAAVNLLTTTSLTATNANSAVLAINNYSNRLATLSLTQTSSESLVFNNYGNLSCDVIFAGGGSGATVFTNKYGSFSGGARQITADTVNFAGTTTVDGVLTVTATTIAVEPDAVLAWHDELDTGESETVLNLVSGSGNYSILDNFDTENAFFTLSRTGGVLTLTGINPFTAVSDELQTVVAALKSSTAATGQLSKNLAALPTTQQQKALYQMAPEAYSLAPKLLFEQSYRNYRELLSRQLSERNHSAAPTAITSSADQNLPPTTGETVKYPYSLDTFDGRAIGGFYATAYHQNNDGLYQGYNSIASGLQAGGEQSFGNVTGSVVFNVDYSYTEPLDDEFYRLSTCAFRPVFYVGGWWEQLDADAAIGVGTVGVDVERHYQIGSQKYENSANYIVTELSAAVNFGYRWEFDGAGDAGTKLGIEPLVGGYVGYLHADDVEEDGNRAGRLLLDGENFYTAMLWGGARLYATFTESEYGKVQGELYALAVYQAGENNYRTSFRFNSAANFNEWPGRNYGDNYGEFGARLTLVSAENMGIVASGNGRIGEDFWSVNINLSFNVSF